jgi:hypothetical protein
MRQSSHRWILSLSACTLLPLTKAGELQCGVLWFLHIGKCGGDSIKLSLSHIAERSQWTYVDLFTHPLCSLELTKPLMSDWSSSPVWRVAEDELNKPQPHLIVHQHHCSPGMGTHLLPQLQRLNETLNARGCRLALATALRSPVARMESDIFYNSLPHKLVRSYVENRSDFQIKYIMFGLGFDGSQASADPRFASWPKPFQSSVATPELMRSAQRTLSTFEIVGKFEELGVFSARLAGLLGVRPVQLGHLHANRTHRYELSPGDQFWMHQHNVADGWLYDSFFGSNAKSQLR